MKYVIAPTNSDLYHHGILGQKWGKRNGPPYPLGSGAHSAAEKRAAKGRKVGGGSYGSSKSKKKYHQYTEVNDSMSAEQKAKVLHDNSVKARSNAVKAFTDARKAAGKVMKYNQKLRKGETDKITNKERKYAEIMNIAIDEYNEARLHASQKSIDKILENKKISDTIATTAAISIASSGYIASMIPALSVTAYNERGMDYLAKGKKNTIIDDRKTIKNRSKANSEYTKKPKTDERVKYYVNKNTKDIARYQTHHEDVDKKNRTAYEYTYDYKRNTAVGKKKLVQYSKDKMIAKTLKEEDLTNDDYTKAEKHIKERKKRR